MLGIAPHSGEITPVQVAKISADLEAAFGARPEVRENVVASELAALAGPASLPRNDVVCHLTPDERAISFGTAGCDTLVVRVGVTDPTDRAEAQAADGFAWQAPDRTRGLLDNWLGARKVPGDGVVLVCTRGWARAIPLARLELRCLAHRMRYLGRLVLACDAEWVSDWQAASGGGDAIPYDAVPGLAHVRAIVLLADGARPDTIDPDIIDLARGVPFSLFRTPQLFPLAVTGAGVRQVVPRATNPHLRHNRFVAQDDDTSALGVADTPVGKARRLTNGLGPMDAFGHRIGGSLKALARRPSSHKVVAVFGGSAVFSPRCFHEDTFPAQLGTLVEAHAKAGDIEGTERVTVLNFGKPAGTITDVLGAFAHFGSLVRPECVIAHIGANEFGAFGNDPALVEDYDILYPTAPDEGTEKRRLGLDNAPTRLAEVLCTRCEALSLMTTGFGARLVVGLQPSLCFKQPVDEEERSLSAALDRRPKLREGVYLAWRSYTEGRAHAVERLSVQPALDFLDLTDAFAAEDGLAAFCDHVHLTPAGANVVAARYAPVIEDALAKAPLRMPPAAAGNEVAAIRWSRSSDRFGDALDSEIAIASSDEALARLASTLSAERTEILNAIDSADHDSARELPRDAYPLD